MTQKYYIFIFQESSNNTLFQKSEKNQYMEKEIRVIISSSLIKNVYSYF